MCSGAEVIGLLSAGAATAGAVQNYENARRARNTARDQAAAVKAADTKATQDANAMIALRRRALLNNSLETGGGIVSGTGRTTLGGS